MDPLIVRVSGSRSPKRAIRLSKKDWHSRAPEVSALPEMKSILERHGATATSPKKGDGPHDRSEHPYVAASFKRPQGAESNMNYTRTEAGRILLSASSHRGMQADDRTYLVRLVTAMTGLAPADAERRVNDVIAQTKESISRARRSAVIFGFMVGASALLGAVAAWFAACAGGRARDGREELHPLWDWARPVSR